MAALFAHPGADPRQWISYGTVDPDTPEARSVRFTDENGLPLPTGPLVTVTLQPSGVTVPCRVSGSCAGNGEADWFPFLGGDEVLVVVPEGDERAGCVIIGRCNQEIDVFPLTVAGQDVTKNTFGFKRLRTPYIIETASSFMIRSAVTGAGLTITPEGNAFFVSGDGHKLVLHGSFLKLEAAGGGEFLQIDPETKELLLSAGGTTQMVFGKTASAFFSNGTLNLGTSGFAGQGHAVTLEQLAVILESLVIVLAGLATPPAWLGGPPSTLVDLALAAASVLPINPTHTATILTGLQIPTDPLGLKPGIGRPGLLM